MTISTQTNTFSHFVQEATFSECATPYINFFQQRVDMMKVYYIRTSFSAFTAWNFKWENKLFILDHAFFGFFTVIRSIPLIIGRFCGFPFFRVPIFRTIRIFHLFVHTVLAIARYASVMRLIFDETFSDFCYFARRAFQDYLFWYWCALSHPELIIVSGPKCKIQKIFEFIQLSSPRF